MVYKKTAQKLKAERKAKDKALKKEKPKKAVALSKQIRDAQRLLKKEGLDYRLKKALNKKLEVLVQQHAEKKQSKLEQKYAARYQKVKFFERRNLEKSIEKLKAKIKKQGGTATENDQKELTQLNDDLQYVLHFPRGEKFVSLLKQAETPEAQEILEKERARLRALVQQSLADEALIGDEDEGKGKGFSLQVGRVKDSLQKQNTQEKKVKAKSLPSIGANRKAETVLSKRKRPDDSHLDEERSSESISIDELSSEEQEYLANEDEASKSMGDGNQGKILESQGLALEDDFFLASDQEADQIQEHTSPAPKSHQTERPKQGSLTKNGFLKAHDRLKDQKGRIQNFKKAQPTDFTPHAPKWREKTENKKPQNGQRSRFDVKKSAVKSQAVEEVENKPHRTRAEGGRKRRKKKT